MQAGCDFYPEEERDSMKHYIARTLDLADEDEEAPQPVSPWERSVWSKRAW